MFYVMCFPPLSGTSIYVVVTTNFVAVPVSIAVQNPSARYALLAALIITSVTVPLCLVFLPKVSIIVWRVDLDTVKWC